MSRPKKWIIGLSAGFGTILLVLLGLGFYFADRFDPFLREQTLSYLRQKFNADVELAALKVRMPLDSPLEILARGGRGAMVRISGERLSLRLRSLPGRPALMAMRRFSFEVDLRSALDNKALVRKVRLEGLELTLPPKGEKAKAAPAAQPDRLRQPGDPANPPGERMQVQIDEIVADGTRLSILPRNPARAPLVFEIHKLRLESAGTEVAMRYQAELTNAKPPGLVRATGTFGPWNTEEPSETPLAGQFDFRDADLSVFKGIAGKLASTGKFQGELSRFEADGEARVPDFRLTASGNPVPLEVTYHAIVDGTNGNTLLDPVQAKLGQSLFDVKGGVVRDAGEKGKTVDLDATFRRGRLDDVLRLAVKGPKPILRGGLGLRVKIRVPPGKGPIENRLGLSGNFRLIDARFTNPEIQNELDVLSRRAQGKPDDTGVAEVPWQMDGTFQMSGGRITFPKLNFALPGAHAEMAGNFVFAGQEMDFHGTGFVKARVSQMMKTRWKRWVLKAVDPNFAKDGYGAVADFKIWGTRDKPQFGLDRGDGKDKKKETR